VHRHRLRFLMVVVLLAAPPLWSATLEQVRQLHDQGKTEEALAGIESLLGSDAPEAHKAEALDLLGTISVEKGHFGMAKQAWTRLQEEYPSWADESDVGTKLLLVSALLKSEDSADTTDPMPALAPPAEPAPEPTPTAEAPAPAPGPAERPEPVEPSAPTLPPAPEPVAAPESVPEVGPVVEGAETSGLVLIAVKGHPYDAMVETNSRIVEFLRQRGVDAANATSGVPVVEDSKMVLPYLLEKGQDDGAGSVLLVSADYMRMQKIVSECYLPAGAELWKLKVSGGTGVKGRPYSASGITEALIERYLEKLEKKIGGPGLPVTLK
jgi:hypothetical protein